MKSNNTTTNASIKGVISKLYPNKQQEILMFKSAGVARYSYNWGLKFIIDYYNKHKKWISIGDLRKLFTKHRNDPNYKWLLEVSSDIPQQAIKDLGEAFKRYWNNNKGHKKYPKLNDDGTIKTKSIKDFPKFKRRGKYDVSFYHLGNKLNIKFNRIKLEKIGIMKINDDNRLLRGDYKKEKIKVYNPRIKYDGKNWLISIGVDDYEPQVDLHDFAVGIDLGIKYLAVVNVIDKPFKNINKSKRMRQLTKKLKRLQKQLSRKYEFQKQQGNGYSKTQNIIKLERKIKLVYKKISDIRSNHIHQVTKIIINLLPKRIVVEDLNIKDMMKNRHLAKAIAEQCFYKFITNLEYKAKSKGMEFVKADRWYPSSKTCSCCGNIKKDLKLKDRTYECNKCGFTLDRDKNASINLANYKLA